MEWSKILMLDHEQGEYETLKQGLTKYGYQMHTTATIPKAMALVGAHQYQVAFVTLSLISDTMLLTQLNAEQPALPVIVILPHEHVDGIPPQVFNRATNVIWKPLTLAAVCLVLDRTLELMALRTLVRQQRQPWCETLTLGISLQPSDQMDNTPQIPFEVALADKLRHIVPNLGVLGRGSLHRAVLSYVEKLLLTIVLSECRGNQVRSSEILGINRNTLRKKIREFELALPRGGA
jgi:DNA-binding NtrC family response regulator